MFKQCVTSTLFKFVQKKYLAYLNEFFRPAESIRKNSTGQNGLCYSFTSDLLSGTEFQEF